MGHFCGAMAGLMVGLVALENRKVNYSRDVILWPVEVSLWLVSPHEIFFQATSQINANVLANNIFAWAKILLGYCRPM